MKLGIFTDSHYSSATVSCTVRYNSKSLTKIKKATKYPIFAEIAHPKMEIFAFFTKIKSKISRTTTLIVSEIAECKGLPCAVKHADRVCAHE